MKAKREQMDEELMVIKLFASNYARDLIYKKNHPVTPKDVVKVFDLGYLGVEKDFPEQKSSPPYKRRKTKICLRKRVQQTTFKKEDSSRTYRLQIEKVQDTE